MISQALRVEPERRYASAGALADDLARHLDGLPVLARPASRGYHARAFVRRNRVPVAAAAAVVAALVVGLAASLVSLGRERDARADAQAEVERASAALGFVVDLFGGSDGAPLGLETPTRDLLAAGERRARAVGADRPAERAVAFSALRDVYGRLDQNGQASRAAAEAVRAARRAYGPGHPHTLDATARYALRLVDEFEMDRAFRAARTAERGYRALGDDGRHRLRWFLATFGADLAWAVYNGPVSRDWLAVSERMLDEAEPRVRAARDSAALVSLLTGRAHLVEMQDGIAVAAPIYHEAYRISRAIDERSLGTLGLLYNHATTFTLVGDYDAAVPIFDSLLTDARRAVGADHPSFAEYLVGASEARVERGRPGDVEQVLAWTASAASGEDPWANAVVASRLVALRAAGRWRDLDEQTARAVPVFAAAGDSAALSWAQAERVLARLALGDTSGALASARAPIVDGYGADEALAHLARACVAAGRGDARRARAALAAAQRSLDDEPPTSWTSRLVRAGPGAETCGGPR